MLNREISFFFGDRFLTSFFLKEFFLCVGVELRGSLTVETSRLLLGSVIICRLEKKIVYSEFFKKNGTPIQLKKIE